MEKANIILYDIKNKFHINETKNCWFIHDVYDNFFSCKVSEHSPFHYEVIDQAQYKILRDTYETDSLSNKIYEGHILLITKTLYPSSKDLSDEKFIGTVCYSKEKNDFILPIKKINTKEIIANYKLSDIINAENCSSIKIIDFDLNYINTLSNTSEKKSKQFEIEFNSDSYNFSLKETSNSNNSYSFEDSIEKITSIIRNYISDAENKIEILQKQISCFQDQLQDYENILSIINRN